MDTTQPCSVFQTVHSHRRWSLLLECLQMCRLYFPLRKRVPQIHLPYRRRLGNGRRQYLPSVCSASGSAPCCPWFSSPVASGSQERCEVCFSTALLQRLRVLSLHLLSHQPRPCSRRSWELWLLRLLPAWNATPPLLSACLAPLGCSAWAFSPVPLPFCPELSSVPAIHICYNCPVFDAFTQSSGS